MAQALTCPGAGGGGVGGNAAPPPPLRLLGGCARLCSELETGSPRADWAGSLRPSARSGDSAPQAHRGDRSSPDPRLHREGLGGSEKPDPTTHCTLRGRPGTGRHGAEDPPWGLRGPWGPAGEAGTTGGVWGRGAGRPVCPLWSWSATAFAGIRSTARRNKRASFAMGRFLKHRHTSSWFGSVSRTLSLTREWRVPQGAASSAGSGEDSGTDTGPQGGRGLSLELALPCGVGRDPRPALPLAAWRGAPGAEPRCICLSDPRPSLEARCAQTPPSSSGW